jgi:hypothetical protein
VNAAPSVIIAKIVRKKSNAVNMTEIVSQIKRSILFVISIESFFDHIHQFDEHLHCAMVGMEFDAFRHANSDSDPQSSFWSMLFSLSQRLMNLI